MNRPSSPHLMIGLLLVLAMPGCGADSPPTEVERFRDEQTHTVTPHGAIEPDSVQEGTGKTVHYQTNDGTWWQTDLADGPEGRSTWKDPIRVK